MLDAMSTRVKPPRLENSLHLCAGGPHKTIDLARKSRATMVCGRIAADLGHANASLDHAWSLPCTNG